MSNGDCIFCKIGAGEMESTKLYETDNVVAILDINPVNPGHTLIVPKKHSVNLLDADEAVLSEMMVVTKKVAQAIVDAFEEYDGFNLNSNNGRIAGQVIPHMHWHIVPRKLNDGLQLWPGKEYKEGEREQLADLIKSKLS
ncbi:HIT family protein [Patescibacteria group bacterium]